MEGRFLFDSALKMVSYIMPFLEALGASMVATCTGLVGVNTITCILNKLLDNRPDLPRPTYPSTLSKAASRFGLATMLVGEAKGKAEFRAVSVTTSIAEGQQVGSRGGERAGQRGGTSSNGSAFTQMNGLHTADPGMAAAAGAGAGGAAAAAAAKEQARARPHLPLFQALALETILGKGFGANLSRAVLHYSAFGPKRYPNVQIVQANIKVISASKCAEVTPSMLPPRALQTLANLLQQRSPSCKVRSSAVRQGCILVTLDVQKLASILHSVRQQRQQQRWNEGTEPTDEVFVEEEERECFRSLQEHVAAAGQEWLHDNGVESFLQQGTIMSVQVLDCMHHFKWDAESRRWIPSGSDLVPFGCQHSVSTRCCVALIHQGQQAEKRQQQQQQQQHYQQQREQKPQQQQQQEPELQQVQPPPPQQQQQQQEQLQQQQQQLQRQQQQQQQQQQHVSHLQQECAGSDTAYADLALEVCTSPEQQILGWKGEEQAQQISSHLALSMVQLLARIEGVHVPVTILGQQAVEEKESPASEYPIRKQVVHVRVKSKNQPCVVQFELWQRHAILAPACAVLLLPAVLHPIAGELSRQAAAIEDQVGPDDDDDNWDCAAPSAAPGLSGQRARRHHNGGMADFVADLGIWFETNNSSDDLLDQDKGKATADAPECGFQEQDRSKAISDTVDLGRGLLQQAVAWGMPTLAELILMGLMKEPYSQSFVDLANGALPDAAGEQELGSEASFECYRSNTDFDSQSEDVCSSSESLLNLALLSRSTDMMAQVLAWGSKYGGRGFQWEWRAVGDHGITPLLRIQALCNTHRELLEMALADLHAGPGLLASWLQEGPRGLLPDPLHRLPFQHTPSSTYPAAPAIPSEPAAEITAVLAVGSPSETMAGSSGSANSAHEEHAGIGATPLIGPQLLANQQTTTQAASHSALLNSCSRMRYWGWLLRCVVLGFPTGKLPDAVLQAHGVPVAGATQEQQQQQQQQQPHQKGSALSFSGDACCVQEAHFRMGTLLRVAPVMYKVSIVRLLVHFVSFCISLSYIRARELHPYLCDLPFYGSLSLIYLQSLSIFSRVAKTMRLEDLEDWLSFCQLLRATVFLLQGVNMSGGRYTGQFELALYLDLVMELGSCFFEQVSLFRFVAVRGVLAASFVPFYYHSSIKHFAKQAWVLHGLCSILRVVVSLQFRHAYLKTQLLGHMKKD